MQSTTTRARAARPPRRRRFGIATVVLAVLAAFGLAACQPAPAATALQLTLSDSAKSQPAASVTVTVFPAGDTTAPATAAGITDADGNVWFTHGALPAGDYVVRFGSPTFLIDGSAVPGSDNARWYNGTATDAATSRDDAATVTVSATEPTQLVESYAVPRGHIDDYVLDAGGTRIDGATVTAYAWPSGKAAATTATTSSGLYHFGDLPAQNYKLEIAKPGYATLYLGANGLPDRSAATLADAPMIPAVLDAYGDPNYTVNVPDEATISGTVTDGADPVGGVWVVAYAAETGHMATRTRSAGDGTFTLHGLSAIGYKVAFIDTTGAHSVLVYGQQNAVELAQGTTVTLTAGAAQSLGTIALPGKDCAAAESGAKTSFVDADLRNCPLRGWTLAAGKSLSYSDLTGADLSGAHLHGVGLFGTVVTDVDFAGADLSYADLASSTFTNVDFTDADFTTTDIGHADLSAATLDGVVSSGIRGIPDALPTGWTLVGGVLTPPA